MRPLADRVVLLTGASRGLGADMARAFAARGSKLALAARSADDLEKTRASVEELGASAIAVPTDVGDLASLRALVADTERRLGPIDVLVNNAGVELVYAFEAAPLEKLEQIIDTNVLAAVRLTRLVVPSMLSRGTGHIVNISSIAGLTPVPFNATYAASKAALVGLSRSLRIELAGKGIGVSVICPGFVEGGMFAAWGRPAPKIASSVSSEKVAESVVDAVLRNRAEVVVTKGLAKRGHIFTSLMPDTSASLMRRMGLVKFFRDQAHINAEKR